MVIEKYGKLGYRGSFEHRGFTHYIAGFTFADVAARAKRLADDLLSAKTLTVKCECKDCTVAVAKQIVPIAGVSALVA